MDRTHAGRAYRIHNISCDYTSEALMIRVDRKLNSTNVVDELKDLFILRGAPEYIRSDNGPEFIAKKVRDWITAVGRRRPRLNLNQLGRTDTAKALMRVFEMSC